MHAPRRLLPCHAWSWGARERQNTWNIHLSFTDAQVFPPQVTPARSGAADKLDLDFVWHLQTPLNCLPEDAAVFMELRHWKAHKKKVRGWRQHARYHWQPASCQLDPGTAHTPAGLSTKACATSWCPLCMTLVVC